MIGPTQPNTKKVEIKTILILQGGGALGAYECGVYKALAESSFLDNLAVVAGTSIGGLNAGLIARHYHEPHHGSDFLERFWRQELAGPCFLTPFLDPADAWGRLNAVWASFLIGHPRLFRPHLVWPIPWIFRAPPTWALETHFYESEPMQDLLSRPGVFGSYGPRAENPRLIVTAVDVVKGKPVAFDSGQEEPVTAAHVVASGSLPPAYPPKKIGGANAGSYWDGGIWSNTPLREVLNALQTANGVRPVGETRYHACIVDVFPQEAAHEPSNSGEVFRRISELTYADKTEYDRKATEWVNEYIDLVQLLEAPDTQLPAPLRAKIDRMVRNKELKHYQQVVDRTRVHVDITAIPRKAYPSWEMEQISGSLDFSSTRIAELIEQGYRTGREHLKELQLAPPHVEAAEPSAAVAGTTP